VPIWETSATPVAQVAGQGGDLLPPDTLNSAELVQGYLAHKKQRPP